MNVDLPWNPSRLEQRKGRVQRIGQVRDDIHVLNLRYAGTVEDDVYAAVFLHGPKNGHSADTAESPAGESQAGLWVSF